MTNHNQGSFSKQEREPWERGWIAVIIIGCTPGIILERIDYPWLKIPVPIIAARAPNMVVQAPKIKRKTSQIIK